MPKSLTILLKLRLTTLLSTKAWLGPPSNSPVGGMGQDRHVSSSSIDVIQLPKPRLLR